MKQATFFCLVLLVAPNLVAACGIDRWGTVVIKEFFNLDGRCKVENLRPGVGCGCYALWAAGNLARGSVLFNLCFSLYGVHPSSLGRLCPRRFFLNKEVEVSDMNRRQIQFNLNIGSIARYLNWVATRCFVTIPAPTRAPTLASRIQDMSSEATDIQVKPQAVDDEMVSLHADVKQAVADIVPSLTKCVRCIRCLKLNICSAIR